MNVVVYEDRRCNIKSFTHELRKMYPKSSTLQVNKDNITKIYSIIENVPIFTSNWCIFCNTSRLDINDLKRLCNTDNLIVINTFSKTSFSNIQETLNDNEVEFSVLDNTKVSKANCINYVAEVLNVDYELSRYICARRNFYFPSIVESTALLSEVPALTKDKVRKYVDKSGNIFLFDVFLYLIGADRNISKNNIITFVNRYRYGIDYCIKYYIKYCKITLSIYSDMTEGKYVLSSAKEYYIKNRKSLPKGLSEYYFLKLVESNKKVSEEFLYLMLINLEKIGSSQMSVIKFINLLKLGG